MEIFSPSRPPAVGSSITGGTENSILFVGAGGLLDQNNPNFTYTKSVNQLGLKSGAVGNTPLKITLFASQTGDAFQVYASDGTTKLWSVDKQGNVAISSPAYGTKLSISDANGQNFALDGDQAMLTIADTYGYGFKNQSTLEYKACVRLPDSSITDVLGIYGHPYTLVGAGLSLKEMTAPAAPTANMGTLYLQDNGAGKTQLMVKFSSGAAQQIAIEP